jgi:O-antigen/teichoic acid export membrane protein
MGDNFKKNMIGALTWSSVYVFGVQAVQLLIGIVLARILMPEHFGLVGILFVFFGLSTVIIDGGFGQGLIKKSDANTHDFSTIFFLNLALSVILYIILFFAAPLIARFFAQPELTALARVSFLAVLIFPLYQTQQIILLRKLNYKALAIVNVISVAISGMLAVVLATNNFGVWALVYQQLAFHFFRFLLFNLYNQWKPDFIFKKDTIRELWRFTLPLFGQSVLNVIFNQIYVVIIGRFYPLKQVGYFTQANKYSETVNAATQGILSMGTFPSFAKIQDDKERLLRISRKLTSSVSLLTFPLVIFLIVAAEPVIVTLISEKWLASVRLLQLLLLANIFSPQYTININILNASGVSATTLKIELIKKVMILLSILVCFSFGIEIMLLGFILANLISYFISMIYVKRLLNHYYRHQVVDIVKTLALAILAGLIVWFFNYLTLGYPLKLAVQGVTYLIIFLLSFKLCYPENFKEAKKLILQK